MTIRVGIIGANWSLKVHGAAWRKLPNVEVVAVCTAHRETAEAAAAMFGVPRAYWNVGEMAADPDIDIIDVGSRPSFRYDMVMAALAAGKHVYDALPFALDVASAEAQATAARDKGLVGVVDAQFRWIPAALQMKAMIDAGYLGEILGFNMQVLLPLRAHGHFIYPQSAFPEGDIAPYKWLADATAGGSGWRNFGSHATLLLSHLAGRVTAATGAQATGVKHWALPDGAVLTPDTADLGCGVLRLENGAIGTIQTGWCVPDAAGMRLELWGTRGRMLLVDPTFGDGISARLYAGDARPCEYGAEAGAWIDIDAEYFAVPGTAYSKSNAPPYMVSMAWMFHDMIAAIRDRRTPSPGFDEAVHAQKVVHAVIQSSETGRWIEIADL